MPPTNQMRIVYYTRMFQALPSLVPLQQECGGNIIIGRSSAVKAFRNVFPRISCTQHRKQIPGLRAQRLLKQADVVFSGAGYTPLLAPLPGKKMLTFHGTLGLIGKQNWEAFSHFDHLFLIGPRMEQQLLRHNHFLNYSYSVTGFLPFSCYPEKTDEICSQILKKLNLNPKQKTIVYTPSKASVGTWFDSAEHIANEIPSEYNLIMRPHPNQAQSRKKRDRGFFQKISAMLKDRPNSIIDMIKCSLPELECVADLMITDANSPAEESLFYDCPQLFSDSNRSSREAFRERFKEWDMHDEDTEAYLQLFDCGPSFHTDGFTHWGEAARFAIENKDQYASAREKCVQYIFGGRDRNAPKRVAEKLEKLI